MGGVCTSQVKRKCFYSLIFLKMADLLKFYK